MSYFRETHFPISIISPRAMTDSPTNMNMIMPPHYHLYG